jgi:hypothetical protein
MVCRTYTIERIPTSGFTLTADKYEGLGKVETTLHISYPIKPFEKLSLVSTDGADTCIQDIELNASGNANVSFTATKSQTIYAIIKGVDCCTTFNPTTCLVSNYIHFLKRPGRCRDIP